MKRFLITQTIIASLAVFGQASGDSCRRSSHAPTYQQTYVAPYVAPTYTTTAFLQVAAPVYPLYGVGYGNDEAKLLREEFLQFRKELLARDAASKPVQPDPMEPAKPSIMAPQPAATPPPGLKAYKIQDPKFNAYIRAECASCHGTKPRQNKLTLMLDGVDTLVDNGPLLNSRIYTRMSLKKGHPKHMPRGGEDCPQEILDMASELATEP